MSSDLHFYDTFFYHNSSPEIVSSDVDLLLPDPFFPFCDSSSDLFSELSINQNNQDPVKNSNTLHNLTPNLLSSSPPSHQLESLSLYCSSTQLQQPVGENLGDLGNGYSNFCGVDNLGVKTEECQMGIENFECCYNNQQQLIMPHSYSCVENVARMMQRSNSSNCFEAKPDFPFKPIFDSLLESSNYQNHGLSPPESAFLAGQMRRVCSTGDLQSIGSSHSAQRSLSSPLASEISLMEDGNFKVGRYSAEERKDRISKYRAKRNQRNFTKTIKYACRKTLANNRPRIRGRFARNDETVEIPKAASSTRHEDEDDFWFDGLHGEEDDGGNREGRGEFVNSYGQTQFQYYS